MRPSKVRTHCPAAYVDGAWSTRGLGAAPASGAGCASAIWSTCPGTWCWEATLQVTACSGKQVQSYLTQVRLSENHAPGATAAVSIPRNSQGPSGSLYSCTLAGPPPQRRRCLMRLRQGAIEGAADGPGAAQARSSCRQRRRCPAWRRRSARPRTRAPTGARCTLRPAASAAWCGSGAATPAAACTSCARVRVACAGAWRAAGGCSCRACSGRAALPFISTAVSAQQQRRMGATTRTTGGRSPQARRTAPRPPRRPRRRARS